MPKPGLTGYGFVYAPLIITYSWWTWISALIWCLWNIFGYSVTFVSRVVWVVTMKGLRSNRVGSEETHPVCKEAMDSQHERCANGDFRFGST